MELSSGKKASTIKDVALDVGVCTATVSAVLGRRSSGHVRVSQSTRARIIEAANRLDYRTNQLAVSLRYRETNVIGVYTGPDYLDPYTKFTGLILGGLNEGTNRVKKDMLLHGNYRDMSPEDVYSELAGGKADGLILYTAPSDEIVSIVTRGTLPALAVVDALPNLPSVVADDAGGSAMIVAHLWERGHRHVFFKPGWPGLVSAATRVSAFIKTASEYGMQVTLGSFEGHVRVLPGEFDWVRQRNHSSPTAIACWNDQSAYNVLMELRMQGIQVPKDVAITGFDDIPPSYTTPQHVTTIRAPWIDVACAAVTVLAELMKGVKIPDSTALPVEFVQGDTT